MCFCKGDIGGKFSDFYRMDLPTIHILAPRIITLYANMPSNPLQGALCPFALPL